MIWIFVNTLVYKKYKNNYDNIDTYFMFRKIYFSKRVALYMYFIF